MDADKLKKAKTCTAAALAVTAGSIYWFTGSETASATRTADAPSARRVITTPAPAATSQKPAVGEVAEAAPKPRDRRTRDDTVEPTGNNRRVVRDERETERHKIVKPAA